MVVELSIATLADCGKLGQIISKAYAEDSTMRQLTLNVKPEEADAFWANWLKHDLPKPGERIFKMVDMETKKIVAFNKVRYPAPMDDENEDFDPPPKGMNVELMDDWFDAMDEYHFKHMDPEKDMFVHVLAVLPEYQRNGLGAELLAASLKDADKQGVRAYLQATPKGESMYPRFGFKDLEDDCNFDTPEGVQTWKCMMRDARPKSK